MRLILGSILLAVAIAAPIQEELPPIATVSTNDIGEHITDQELLYALHREQVPEEAIREFFAEGFNTYTRLPITQEMFDRLKAWGKKWNIEKVEWLRYDAEKQIILIPKYDPEYATAAVEPNETTTTAAPEPKEHHSIPIEEINAWAIQHEGKLREAMRSTGIPEQAVDEMFEQEFHLLPMTMEKYLAIQKWGKKWNVKEVEDMTFSETVTNDETPSDTVHVEPEEEITTTTEAPTTTEDPSILDEEIRQHFRAAGIPEAAIQRYIEEGFARPPFDEVKVERMNIWSEGITAFMVAKQRREQKMRQEKEVGTVITRRVAQFFENLYIVSRAAQHITESGQMDMDRARNLRDYINNLSDLERLVFERVVTQITKKTLIEYGI